MFKLATINFIAAGMLLLPTVSKAQGLSDSTYGLGAKMGYSAELGAMNGFDLFYRSGSFQYEFYSVSSAINLKHSFSNEIKENNVFVGGTPQGKINAMDASSKSMGLNVRWFLENSMNIAFGFANYQVDVVYELESLDASEVYENQLTASTNAMTISFGNQWKFPEMMGYIGLDYIASFLPTKVEVDGLTATNEQTPVDAGNLKVDNKIKDKTSSLSGSPANYITLSFGIEL